MAYVNKELTKRIRTELKAKFPDCIWSVINDNYLAVRISLMKAPESPFSSLEYYKSPTDRFSSGPESHDGYMQLNHYYIEQDRSGQWHSNGAQLTEKAAQMLKEVVEIANKGNHDNSDLMTDYFDVGWYVHLQIGQWDKPFQVKELTRKEKSNEHEV